MLFFYNKDLFDQLKNIDKQIMSLIGQYSMVSHLKKKS